MRYRRLLIILAIATLLLVVAVAIMVNPFRGLKLLASVVDATAQPSDTVIDAPNAVQFAEDEVSTLTTPRDELIETHVSSSSIEIVHDSPTSISRPDLVVEEIVTDTGTMSKYSFDYDTLTLINAIHTYTNQLRENDGLAPFVLDPLTSTVAIERSADMANHHTFSHTSSDGCDLGCRFEKSQYSTLSWGENIAEYEPYTRLTPQTLARVFVEKWAKSSEHKRNLLSSDFTHQGVGVAMNGNRLVVTVVFTRPVE